MPDSYLPVNLVNYPLEHKLFGTITPMTLACVSGHPEAVILLLRHGAASLHPYTHVECPRHDWSQPLFALVNQLNAFPPSRTRDSDPSDPDDQRGNRGQDLLTCLIYVARTMTTVPVKKVPVLDVDHVCEPQVLEILSEFADHLLLLFLNFLLY